MGLQTWKILSRTLCYFLIRTTSHQTNFNNNKTGQITKPDVIFLTDNTSTQTTVEIEGTDGAQDISTLHSWNNCLYCTYILR